MCRSLDMKKHAQLFSQAVQPLLLLGLTATLCSAQASPFGQVAQGVSLEVVGIVKWVGIIIAVVVGLSLAGGGSHGSHGRKNHRASDRPDTGPIRQPDRELGAEPLTHEDAQTHRGSADRNATEITCE